MYSLTYTIERMSGSFFMQITRDVTEGTTLLRVQGTQEAWLENYQSLLEYTDERIDVRGTDMGILLIGSGMRIEYYGTAEMKITGSIQKIEFGQV